MSMTLNEGSYTQAEQARGTGAPLQRRDGLVRCAIYTRKSTDEGLDQDFNSLDAQRESAEAYILSHKHEGWVCLPERYDDGGFTGGNMERPALKRLLADIEAGEIDCVVACKADRLSRSLLDFARIMETFEKHGVSFVSVSQVFPPPIRPFGRFFCVCVCLPRVFFHLTFAFAPSRRLVRLGIRCPAHIGFLLTKGIRTCKLPRPRRGSAREWESG